MEKPEEDAEAEKETRAKAEEDGDLQRQSM